METIINNAGVQHLAEKVFWNLDVPDLKICEQINQSCKHILENPIFWLKKFRSLSKDNLKEWIKAIKLLKNSEECKDAIITYLQWKLKEEALEGDELYNMFCHLDCCLLRINEMKYTLSSK